MATGTLGSLSIDVLANIAGMVSDLGKAQAEAAKFSKELKETVEAAGEKVQETFAEIGASLGLAFSVDRVIEFGARIAEQAERVNNLSQSLGVSTQAIQTLGFAAALTGGTIDTVSGGLAKLERSAVQAEGGNKLATAAFDALGVSITDSSGKLKSADELFSEVAGSLARFADGPQKTAVAMQLMGRGAAEQIPFLNKLGTEAESLREEAEALGVVMSGSALHGLVDFKEETNLLSQEVQGLGNTFMSALAPALTEIVTRLNILLRSGDAKSWADSLANGIHAALDLLDDMSMGFTAIIALGSELWVRWKVGIEIAMEYIKFAFDEGMTYLKNNAIDAGGVIAKALAGPIGGLVAGSKIDEFTASLHAAGPSVDDLNARIAKLRQTVVDNTKASGDAVNAAAADIESKHEAVAAVQKVDDVLSKYRDDLASTTDKAGAHMAALRALDDIEKGLNLTGAAQATVQAALQKATDEVTASYDRASAKTLDFNASTKTIKDSTEKAVEGLIALQSAVDAIAGKAGDDYAKSWATYEAEVDKVTAAYAKAVTGASDFTAADALLNQGLALANEGLQKRDAILQALHTVQQESGDQVSQLIQKYTEEEDVMTQSAATRAKVTAEMADEKQMRDAVTAAIKAGHPEYAQELQDLLAIAKAHADEIAAAKADQQALQEWQGIASKGLDSVGASLASFITTSGGSWKKFGASLVDDTRQFIAQIIQEFLKLEAFNGIINSLFGSNLPTGMGGILGSLFGGGAGGGLVQSGSEIASSINSGLLADISADMGGGGMLAQSAGNALSGVTSAANTIDTTNGLMGWLFGSSFTDLGGAGVLAGQGAFFGSAAEGAGGYAGYLGDLGDYGTAAGGGAVAGATSSLFDKLSGPLAIVGAGLAGLNEYNAAGGGVGGVAGGLAYGVGTYFAGAAATAALSAGVAGGVSAGLAAGFAAIPVVGWIALAAMGLNALTGGGLFGTAATPYASTETVQVGAAAASVSATEVSKGKKAFFGGSYYDTQSIPVPQSATDSINQAFVQLQNTIANDASLLGESAGALVQASFKEVWDKNGKMMSETSTVMGKQYTEDLTAFWSRVTADNMLALLPASQNATAIAAAWQSDAKTLLDGTQMLVAAQIDMNRGMGLLGSGDSSLSDVAKVVQELAQSGEALTAAYSRLQAEQTDLAHTLDELQLSTGKSGADFVVFADQLTAAAGGLQNLDKLWADFFKNFYSSSQQQTNSLASSKSSMQQLLQQIGEDPNVSMSQFAQDFATKMPTLTASQVVQWLDAAEALSTYTNAVAASAATLAAAKQKYADYEISTQGDAFTQAMAKVIESEKAQIDTANQLAQAAGFAGASQKDLAYIMGSGTAAMGQAIANLTTGIVSDINQLFPTASAASGNTQWDATLALGGSGVSNTTQIAANAAKAAAGYDLIQKIGDFAYASNISISDALKVFGQTPEKIAAAMGTSADKVSAQLDSAKSTAASLITQVAQGATQIGLLQDLLATMQGKPLPFDIGSLGATPTQPVAGGKIGGGTGYTFPGGSSAQPGADVVTAINKTSAKAQNQMADIGNTLRRIRNFGWPNRNTRQGGPTYVN